MEPTDFYLFVLPMGVLVGILVLLVFRYARSEERQKKKLVELINTYMRNRRKQKEIFAQELEKLQALLHQKSIDKTTYKRLRKILEMNLAQRLEELKAHV